MAVRQLHTPSLSLEDQLSVNETPPTVDIDQSSCRAGYHPGPDGTFIGTRRSWMAVGFMLWSSCFWIWSLWIRICLGFSG